jgi:hydrogenase/urease accessory protein HupE
VLLYGLHFGFELTQISFQLRYLLGFRLIAALEPVTGMAATSATTLAMAFDATTILA